jgi:hypothetical protein
MDLSELRREVSLDKQRALEVIQAAREKRAQPILSPLDESNVHTPGGVDRFVSDRLATQQELGVLCSSPFFARVEVTFAGESRPLALLVSKARAAGEINKDGEWEIISFTSPLYATILDRDAGTEFQTSAACRGIIGASAKFESLLPQLQRAGYVLRSGRVFLESEKDLDRPDFLASPLRTPKRYTAAQTFGLGEIIELADKTQRTAMHLPFVESVLIEGPPGSGKTSVGIMRIPCLIDRQWQERGLNPEKDQPFHTAASMRILVLNEQMVDYLVDLVRSLRIDGVVVGTVNDLLLRICDDAGTLKGREGVDAPILAKLKAMPYTLSAYWAGFQSHAQGVLTSNRTELQRRFENAEEFGRSIWKRLEAWFKAVASSGVQNETLPLSVNLAVLCSEWHANAVRDIPDAEKLSLFGRLSGARRDEVARINADRTVKLSAIISIRTILEEVFRLLLDRRALTLAMFSTPQYVKVLELFAQDTSAAFASEADLKWRHQMEPKQPTRTEYDGVLASWLGVHVSLIPAIRGEPFVGGRLDRFTHLMIDESQDLSTTHSVVLNRLICDGGTLTFVGDLRQRLSPVGGLRSWDELRVPSLRRAAFVVNHRQSLELGQFVAGLHERLFDEQPVWKPSQERRGPVPIVRTEVAPDGAPAIAAREVRRWRTEIPRATIGLLFDGRWTSTQFREFKDRLEAELSDSPINVVAVEPGTPGGVLRKTDCVILASVSSTKGLEFDAVVFVDPLAEWNETGEGLSLRRRHGLYVATSRAKQGLSLILTELPRSLTEMAQAGLCTHLSA